MLRGIGEEEEEEAAAGQREERGAGAEEDDGGSRRIQGIGWRAVARRRWRKGGLGGWLVMHCANSPRRGHVTRTPGLSLIAPRRNVGHTVPAKALYLAPYQFSKDAGPQSRGQEGGGRARNESVESAAL